MEYAKNSEIRLYTWNMIPTPFLIFSLYQCLLLRIKKYSAILSVYHIYSDIFEDQVQCQC